MAKREKESEEFKEIGAASLPLVPLCSNVVRAVYHTDFVMLDFGFAAPSYSQPYPIEDTQIARICLDWDSGEYLLENLKEVVAEHKKAQESKPKKRTK